MLSAADFAADVHFFTDIVALLFQAAPLPSTTFASGREHSPKSSSNRYPVDLSSERSSEVGADGSQGGGTATVIASGVGDFGGRIDSTRADDGRVTTLLLSLCAQLVKVRVSWWKDFSLRNCGYEPGREEAGRGLHERTGTFSLMGKSANDGDRGYKLNEDREACRVREADWPELAANYDLAGGWGKRRRV